jgi:hypothetical protein
MTDAEISRRLALAIGWKESDIIEYPGQDYVGIRTKILAPCVRLFSYKFPTVIWPIAERFNCFPIRRAVVEAGWIAWSGARYCTANTAAKAVALVVIKHHEGSKT